MSSLILPTALPVSRHAKREAPNPVLLIETTSPGCSSPVSALRLGKRLQNTGYNSLHIELSRYTGQLWLTSEDLMNAFANELRSYFISPALDSFPRYPPIIIAAGSATLFAQTYISSYPAASMVLISPPTSNRGYYELDSCGEALSSPAPICASVNSSPPHGAGSYLPTPLREFNYEPRLPICLLDDARNRAHLLANHRLLNGGAHESSFVRTTFLEGIDEERIFTEIMTWLDELGF